MTSLGLFVLLVPVLGQETQLTNLPTIYITTNGNAPILDKTTWVPGTIKIVTSGDFPARDTGPVEIRGRGNSTWHVNSKKPYRIRIPRNTPSNLLGMPSNARNWVLLANFFDNTLVRNALAFEISKFFGFSYSPPYRFVDLYLNGVYVGNYTMTDHMQVENNRVDVEEQESDDTDPQTITGGYFVQEEVYARDEDGYFQTSYAGQYDVKYPDSEDINEQQKTYIRNYIQNYEDRLFSSAFRDPVNGYGAVVDRFSQVNWQIANELTANIDSYLSVYLSKKRNDPKLYFGPMWDYDKSFNDSGSGKDMAFRSMVEESLGADKIKRMMLDSVFVNAIRVRWRELRANGLYSALESKLTEFAQTLQASQQLNFQLPNIAPNPINPPAYNDRIAELKRFLRRRIGYLDYYLTREIDSGRYYKIGDVTLRRVVSAGNSPQFALSLTGDSETANTQDWLIVPAGSDQPGYFTIKNRGNGLLLTVDGGGVRLADQQSSLRLSQIWKIQQLPDQSYVVILTHPNGGSARSLAREGVTGLSLNPDLSNLNETSRWFFVGSEVEESALPVDLSEFKASLDEKGVILDWTVSEATQFSHFEVERTRDPREPINQSLGKVDMGDLNSGTFQFVDTEPYFGHNYYRLKMIDLDGSFNYTNWVSVKYAGVLNLGVYPVPASSKINISFESKIYRGGASATFYNNLGTPVQVEKIEVTRGNNNLELNVESLNPGLYHLRFDMGSEVFNKRVVISE